VPTSSRRPVSILIAPERVRDRMLAGCGDVDGHTRFAEGRSPRLCIGLFEGTQAEAKMVRAIHANGLAGIKPGLQLTTRFPNGNRGAGPSERTVTVTYPSTRFPSVSAAPSPRG
jgi:hypothetical protein